MTITILQCAAADACNRYHKPTVRPAFEGGRSLPSAAYSWHSASC